MVKSSIFSLAICLEFSGATAGLCSSGTPFSGIIMSAKFEFIGWEDVDIACIGKGSW